MEFDKPRPLPLCLLLIHGFGGSVEEVRPLADRLEAAGIPVVLARLAGHGEGRPPIDNLPYTQWVDSVRVQRQLLEQSYRVIPVGFSMGGLIAAVLNSESPFPGMVFLNTPIYFWNLPQVVKNLLFDFGNARRYYFRSAGQVTAYTMLQFLRLLLRARGLFSLVDCPALVVQARDDDSVWPASADFIRKRLRRQPEFYIAASGSHQVLGNPVECQAVARRVAALYERLAQ